MCENKDVEFSLNQRYVAAAYVLKYVKIYVSFFTLTTL